MDIVQCEERLRLHGLAEHGAGRHPIGVQEGMEKLAIQMKRIPNLKKESRTW